jgi:hypothetical protein
MSLLLLFHPSAEIVDPTLDSVVSGIGYGGSVSDTIEIGSNSDRLVVVSISTQGDVHPNLEVSNVTVGGVALVRAEAIEHTADVRAEIWYGVAPTVGSQMLLITTVGPVFIGYVASSWYGMNQTAQPHTLGKAIGNSELTAVELTPLSSKTLIIDALSSQGPRTALGANQTSLGIEQGAPTENISSSYRILATAATVEMQNTIVPSGYWAQVAVAFNPTDAEIVPPTIVTNEASSISVTSVTGNANITATGGSTVTRRGFQFNTIQYPDRETYEDGTFSTGAFTLPITGLYPNTTYYYRAFARTAAGVSYGSWRSFTTAPSSYSITIDGVDRTDDVIHESIDIEDVINDEQNTCSFQLVDLHDVGVPEDGDEIIVTLQDGTILFGGYITNVSLGGFMQNGVVTASIQSIDYVWILDRNLVHRTYEDMTDKEIIEDVVTRYCADSGITTENVIEGSTITQISFNYLQPSQVLRRLADLTGKNWYIDYEKDIHFFPLTTTAAPFNITSTSGQHFNLQIAKDATQIKNRVYVRGGTKLSDFTTFIEVGDGEKRQFVLPDKPHDITVEIDRGGGYVEESVGIKNIDLSGFKWYLNFQEKYLEQDDGEVVLGATDKLKLTYKYDIPILVALENQASIIAHGVREFAIFDKTITTTESARDRASAELTDYASNIVEGSFETYETGFVSGQYININHSGYGVNADYIVQSVSSKSFGAGNYSYEIKVASAKTMGIIRFLLELLESNKNLIELDDNEVVDELLTLTDSILSDSLIDSLTIDSAGPYATWCGDSLETSPSTRARWDLFQWG